MKLYMLEPEVSGGHGEKTIYGEQKDIEQNGISGKVKYLHYEFDGWLGDELLETTPCFIVTDRMKESLLESFSGDFSLEECLISVSEEFRDLYPTRELPNFLSFIPNGTIFFEGGKFKDWSGHNFCLSQKGELVVTDGALNVLKQHDFKHCDIYDLVQL